MVSASTPSDSLLRPRSILLVSTSIASVLLFLSTFGVPFSTSVYFSRIAIPSVPESYDAQAIPVADSGPVLSATGAFFILRLDETERISKRLISFVGFAAFIAKVASAVDLAVFIHGQECLGGTPLALRGGSANWLTLSAGLIMALGVLLAIRAQGRSSWTMMEDPETPCNCVNSSQQTPDEEKAYPEALQDISTPLGIVGQDEGSDFGLQSNQSTRRSSTPSLLLTPQSREPSHFAPSNYDTAASSSRDSTISVGRESRLAPSVPVRARISTPSFLGHYFRRAGSSRVPTISTGVSSVSRRSLSVSDSRYTGISNAVFITMKQPACQMGRWGGGTDRECIGVPAEQRSTTKELSGFGQTSRWDSCSLLFVWKRIVYLLHVQYDALLQSRTAGGVPVQSLILKKEWAIEKAVRFVVQLEFDDLLV